MSQKQLMNVCKKCSLLLKHYLRPRSFLLFLVQSEQRYISHLNYFKTNSGNISDGVTFTTETGYQYFVVFFNIIKTTVPGYESCDLLAVLDQLHPDALTNGRVRLFSFYTDL